MRSSISHKTLLFFVLLVLNSTSNAQTNETTNQINPAADTQTGQLQTSNAAITQNLVSKMRKAFGGTRDLERVNHITYTLTRTSYQNGDTVKTRHLWYMNMKKPEVLRFDISGKDTIASTQATDALLRSRSFNFLYMLASPDITYKFEKKHIYQGQQVSIVSANDNSSGAALDLFVTDDGRIVTSSTADRVTGRYETFADEEQYMPVGDIVFPMVYRVIRDGKVSAEGLFTELTINRLSAFWKKALASRSAG
ncbi:MAG TPA: hypothetical protein VGE26_11315 [Sphingobacteriaceae bacterium]